MKIALAQTNPIIADIEGNLKTISHLIEKAAQDGADLIVFPEMATIGYPPMDLVKSTKLIDDNLRALESIALQSKDIAIICGYVDYDQNHAPMLFNSAAFMTNGEVASRHHKTLLPQYDVFDELRYFTPAREHNTVTFRGLTLGITICEDIWNSLESDEGKLMEQVTYPVDPVSLLAGKSVDMILNLSASPFVKGKNRVRTEMLCQAAKDHDLSIV